MMYYSLPDEVNTHRFIDHLVACGKKVLLPEVIDDHNMVLREYTGSQDLREGAYHIMEPAGALFPPHRYSGIDVAIIPGMAFDIRVIVWAGARPITTASSRRFLEPTE